MLLWRDDGSVDGSVAIMRARGMSATLRVTNSGLRVSAMVRARRSAMAAAGGQSLGNTVALLMDYPRAKRGPQHDAHLHRSVGAIPGSRAIRVARKAVCIGR